MNKDLLHELFDYEDGQLINKFTRNSRAVKGKIAGCKKARGYTNVCINSKHYLLHRLIWIYHNGDIKDGLLIDHINCDKSDNRIENLRLVTHQENNLNNPNAKGYTHQKGKNRWNAFIGLNGKQKYLGSFDKEKDARQAYLKAKSNYHNIEVHHA